MKLVSPMQRYWSSLPAKNALGEELEDDGRYEEYTDADLNPVEAPCGGAKAGRIHFDAEMGSKTQVQFKTVHSDKNGNCTFRIGDGLTDADEEF